MDDEEGLKKDSDLVAWLLGLILLAVLIGSLITALNNRLGIDLNHPRGALYGIREGIFGPTEFSDLTAIGTTVEAAGEIFVWDVAGTGGELLDVIRSGIFGNIIDGPQFVGGVRWWKVSFENGVEGWVSEDGLSLVGRGQRLGATFGLASTIISLLLGVGIVYSLLRLSQVRRVEMERLAQIPADFGAEEKERSPEWVKIHDLISSENPNDWKQAILAADSMLDKMVARMGYHGDNLGERLKSIEKSDFLTLESAWEAHKVRNTIAHEGSDFILTQREARRIIGLFEKVFDEFQLI